MIIIVLLLIFIALFIGSFIVQYFAHAVPFLGAIATPLIIICVVVGLLLAIFVGIKIYKDIGHKK